MAIKGPTEAVLCVQFMKQLKQLQSLHYFESPFIIMHVANERKSTGNNLMDMLYNKKLKEMGMLKGAPDYIVMYRFGKVAAIEFKRDKSCKLSELQQSFKADCEEIMVPHLTTYNIEEAIGFIRDLTSL